MKRRRPPAAAAGGIAALSVASGAMAWRDLNRRAPSQVRGSKRLWRMLIALNPGNSILYWVFGRR